jgi:hypothetical protein
LHLQLVEVLSVYIPSSDVDTTSCGPCSGDACDKRRHSDIGMTIRVRVPNPMGTDMGMIFYPCVAPVPNPNRTGRVFFSTRV